MTRAILGLLCDRLGHSRNGTYTRSSLAFRSRQPAHVPIDRSHDHRWCGQVLHLERGADARLWCIAEVDAEPGVVVRVAGQDVVVPDAPMYLSAESTSDQNDRDIVLDAVSLVPSPAQVGLRSFPVRWFPGPLDARSTWPTDMATRALLNRAAESRYNRDALVIHEHRDWRSAWSGTTAAHRHAAGGDEYPSNTGWTDHLGRPSRGPTARGATGHVLNVR